MGLRAAAFSAIASFAAQIRNGIASRFPLGVFFHLTQPILT
jgi:hypothetical protein